MILTTSALWSLLRSLPNEAQLSVRAQDGNAVFFALRHEAEILLDNGHVEGVGSRREPFKYLRLTVAPRVAMARLRKRLCSTGRIIAEACQLIGVQEVAGRRVLYAHHTRRIAAYEPSLRSGSHPTYFSLRVAEAT